MDNQHKLIKFQEYLITSVWTTRYIAIYYCLGSSALWRWTRNKKTGCRNRDRCSVRENPANSLRWKRNAVSNWNGALCFPAVFSTRKDTITSCSCRKCHHFPIFSIPTTAAGNFPALMLEYFFSPGISVHFFSSYTHIISWALRFFWSFLFWVL